MSQDSVTEQLAQLAEGNRRIAELLDRLAGAQSRAEERITDLEVRMAPGPDWKPEPGNVAEAGLLAPYVVGRGGDPDFAPHQEATGFPLSDMSSGALQARTWPQLLTCVRYMAGELAILVDRHDALFDEKRVLQAVSELIEAVGVHS